MDLNELNKIIKNNENDMNSKKKALRDYVRNILIKINDIRAEVTCDNKLYIYIKLDSIIYFEKSFLDFIQNWDKSIQKEEIRFGYLQLYDFDMESRMDPLYFDDIFFKEFESLSLPIEHNVCM